MVFAEFIDNSDFGRRKALLDVPGPACDMSKGRMQLVAGSRIECGNELRASIFHTLEGSQDRKSWDQ